MLLSSFFARSMAFTHTPKVQLPFALFSETFLTIRQNSLYVTVAEQAAREKLGLVKENEIIFQEEK